MIWHGPYANPITAVASCLTECGYDNMEFSCFMLYNLMQFDVETDGDVSSYLTNLLEEIAAATNVVVKFEEGRWFSTMEEPNATAT